MPINDPDSNVPEPLAVIGMACRLPGGSNSPHALWEFLKRGDVAKNTPPPSRFSMKHHDGSRKPGTMRSPGGMFLENVDVADFDAQFFGISRTDAIAMDPQQRQLLEVVYECLENSGLRLEDIYGAAVGCFVGSYAVDYADIQARDPEDRAPSVTIGVGRAILSNRISHYLNIKGPSMTIDTACSGSLVSLDVACRYLKTREIDAAIVAGANLYLNPEHNMDSGAMKGASSLTGMCHTFDEKADGYIKAEGINAIIVKRYSDAIRDGDPVRAVIRGIATNSDGRTAGIASPSAEAQIAVVSAAYANAGIADFSDTAYLECHGTGTQAGDPIEVNGMASVFSSSKRPVERPLIIGSVKSNIGHSEPAAGLSGLLKVILALEHSMIPGNPTFINPNPRINWSTGNIQATRTTIPWPDKALRRASVNSFGYGGSNAHVVVEDAQLWSELSHVSSYLGETAYDDFFMVEQAPAKSEQRVLVFSANEETSLKETVQKMKSHLLNPQVKVQLQDLAFTLSEKRSRHFHGAFVISDSSDFDEHRVVYGKKNPEEVRIGFVFTGQGAQWSQMGKQFVETFPQVKTLLGDLDEVLQNLDATCRPGWSLVEELTQERSPTRLREPEISQPLVTALQICLVTVLEEWGVIPQAVAGHSSGEIAAAYAAGLISKEDAITTAFFRGEAARRSPFKKELKFGMMAVGLGIGEVSEYLEETSVQVACYNSPNSLTLSGLVTELETIKSRLVTDNHFARLLQVDLPYHSSFMGEIGEDYRGLLAAGFDAQPIRAPGTIMFSTVSGSQMDRAADGSYWIANMQSPVRFDEAVSTMLRSENAPNFLVEIGPSGALAGPISQILKTLPGGGADVQYFPALSRGQNSVRSTFEVAGNLFLAGGNVKWDKVNRYDGDKPQFIVDLPNYIWNHSEKYWYESIASREWRYRMFPHHDLLGSKLLGDSYHSPTWQKTLVVENLAWLKDHRMGSDIVFPAAGFIAMAIEAMYQISTALSKLEGRQEIVRPCYKLRNLTFTRSLVLEEGEKHRLMLTLGPRTGVGSAWYEYKVFSLKQDVWNEHSRGLITIQQALEEKGTETEPRPVRLAVAGLSWYKAMNDAGYGFGPSFQRLLGVETIAGQRRARATVDLAEPPSAYQQSYYPIHPACLDGCFQTCAPSLWQGRRNSVNTVLVPAIIDELTVVQQDVKSRAAIAVSTARHVGLGRREPTKNYMSDSSVYDKDGGNLLVRISGLRYHQLDTGESPYEAHRYSVVVWKPDFEHLSQLTLLETTNDVPDSGRLEDVCLHTLLDLAAHKNPRLRVMEIVSYPGILDSLWLDVDAKHKSARDATSKIRYATANADGILGVQERHKSAPYAEFAILDISQPLAKKTDEDKKYDLVIVRAGAQASLQPTARALRELLAPNGRLLTVQYGDAMENGAPTRDSTTIVEELVAEQFTWLLHVPHCDSVTAAQAYLFSADKKEEDRCTVIEVISFTKPTSSITSISDNLKSAYGWDVVVKPTLETNTTPGNLVLVLDDLVSPTLPRIKASQWEALKRLLARRNKILWVTHGSQMDVSNPNGAMIHGLLRTVRAEEPTLRIATLDVGDPLSSSTLDAIDTILRVLAAEKNKPKIGFGNEFVERRGSLYVSRIRADELLNKADQEMRSGADLANTKIHEAGTTIRLRAERIGTLDSLTYGEVSFSQLPLGENSVEVELEAAGVNFKDLAITMGIVPGDESLLGLEGAGRIRRAGSTSYRAGQRVLVFEKGTFANRIIATTERVYPIPDSMTYEEASTLASVYLTALYSLYDLADTQAGQRVLIHSATGGLGIACIQICQYIGAEIFATVGTEEKRRFLIEEFNIPSDHIYSSRSTAFGAELLRATENEGVEVILNSLTGDLLEESWRCIREGGTMIELGKRDMLDRNYLPMEMFGRNVSYRCFDMSHDQVTDALIARLLKQLFGLLETRQLKPIYPIKTFPFEDIPAALRLMRGAGHIGKLVISNHERPSNSVEVPVRPSPRTLRLRDDAAYLLVGGLKGLCGSLAVELARLGARYLVVMARSGSDDAVSQRILRDIQAEGAECQVVKGDVALIEDVRRTFAEAPRPIAGIIQGAMVLRDAIFTTMAIDNYYRAVRCKLDGTWNLHHISQEYSRPLDFFTMLSSISGVVGQKGQANYAAANVFLDAFAAWRRGQGLVANSVDLGAIEDVGYMSRNSDLLDALDRSAWTPINEPLFLSICRMSMMQQMTPINESTGSQLITSLAVPQSEDSNLLVDVRFSGLCSGHKTHAGSHIAKDGASELNAFFALLRSQADASALVEAAMAAVNERFMKLLRLSEPMEPGKPLSAYGMDSLASVEFRNWVREAFNVELTTLEIVNASSLIALTQKIVSKVGLE